MALAHAIFASLELQTMAGYNLKTIFDTLVGHLCTTTQSRIFKTLSNLEQERWGERTFIERDHKPNSTKDSIIKTGRANLCLGMTALLDARIKTAEDLRWSKHNSERRWTVLDKLFRAAQVVNEHLALVAQLRLLQRYPSL